MLWFLLLYDKSPAIKDCCILGTVINRRVYILDYHHQKARVEAKKARYLGANLFIVINFCLNRRDRKMKVELAKAGYGLHRFFTRMCNVSCNMPNTVATLWKTPVIISFIIVTLQTK